MNKQKEYKFIPKKGSVEVITNILKIRKGLPDYKNIEEVSKAKKGEILEYIGYVLDGENFEGVSRWYVNSSGDFYWAGGVKELKDTKISLTWPVKKKFQRLSQPFNVAWSANKQKQHSGVDILVPPEEPVFACASGKIIKIGNLDNQGKWAQYIVIRHNKENYCTAYLHVKPNLKVKIGKEVKKKEIIAYVADMNSAHLHFNLWKGGYKKITMRGALPLPENVGKIYPFDDPVFPNNFIDPISINYDFIT